MKLFQVPAANSYAVYGIIPNIWTIYQMKSLQVFAAFANLWKGTITYLLAVQESQLRKVSEICDQEAYLNDRQVLEYANYRKSWHDRKLTIYS